MEAATTANVQEKKLTTKIKLLIADNNNLIRTMYKYSLSEHETVSVEAVLKSAADCIDFLNAINGKIDVIILDLKYNRMEGFDLIQVIRERFSKIKIIVSTSYDNEEYVAKALSMGVDAYISKDIELNELYNVVNSVYDGAMWIDKEASAAAKRAFLGCETRTLAKERAKHIDSLLETKKRAIEDIIREKILEAKPAPWWKFWDK